MRWDEWNNHPVRLLEDLGIGLATGVVAGAAIAFSPVLGTAALVGGGLYAGYQLAENLPGWVSAAEVASNPGQHSATDVAQAEQTLKNVGAGALDLAFMGLGGWAGCPPAALRLWKV